MSDARGLEGVIAAAIFASVVAAALVCAQLFDLRQVMRDRGARSFAGSLYLSPQAWVLVVPLAHIGSKEKDVLETVRQISAALDQESPARG